MGTKASASTRLGRKAAEERAIQERIAAAKAELERNRAEQRKIAREIEAERRKKRDAFAKELGNKLIDRIGGPWEAMDVESVFELLGLEEKR